MAKTNKKYASERMKKNNPMHNEEARAKMAETLARIGHKPRVQGGNGRPAPVAQQLLADALKWKMEHVVVTGDLGKSMRCPPGYKIDIACPTLKVAIEVDGFSHCSRQRQEQDAKKDRFLTLTGWTVLRFSNEKVLTNLEGCLSEVSRITFTTSK
jgi:hypothetical protein